jgi:hypothetical protein
MTRRLAVNGLCAADGGAAAEQFPRHLLDGGGEGAGGGLVLDQRPRHHMDLQARTGPLQHGDADRLRHQRQNRLEHLRISECRRVAALLQLETILAHAARCVDREHELEVDFDSGRRRAVRSGEHESRGRGAEATPRNRGQMWRRQDGWTGHEGFTG